MRRVPRSGWEGRRAIGFDAARQLGERDPAARFHAWRDGYEERADTAGSLQGVQHGIGWNADAVVLGLRGPQSEVGPGALHDVSWSRGHLFDPYQETVAGERAWKTIYCSGRSWRGWDSR